jgi:alpha/beta hydrolase family protein
MAEAGAGCQALDRRSRTEVGNRMHGLRNGLVAGTVSLFVLAACSSSARQPATRATTTTSSVPTGPVADITGPVTGGKGINLLSATPADLATAGYGEAEFFAAGTARSYRPVGTLGNDGRWQVEPADSAAYKTRLVVRKPTSPAKFNGTVLVEWLNVSAGSDSAPDFTYLAPEILRSGYAWVGVSAQQVGVSGGGSALAIPGAPSGGLRGADPVRYGSLQHPGDAFAFDIFSQVARAVRTPGAIDVLGGLRPQRVLALGESQSAFAMTSYVNGIQPQARLFDGFFVHSRGGGALPFAGGNVASAISGTVRIRDDIAVPVFLIETETDETFLGYFGARQPDSDHIRLWDVAGASHADAYIVGGAAAALGCSGRINAAPTHFVLEAALHQLDQWVRTGQAPPSAPRMAVTLQNGSAVVQRDALGVAVGGVRSGAIDAPVAAYSGVAPDTASIICRLFGTTHPFDAATLHRLYPTKAAYLTAFTNATDKAITSGYILPADRAELLAQAQQVAI